MLAIWTNIDDDILKQRDCFAGETENLNNKWIRLTNIECFI